MKSLFTLLILMFGLQVFSQKAIVSGRITDSAKMGTIEGAQIHFLKNDTTITSGFRGSYRIELKKFLADTMVVTHWKYGTVKMPVSLRDGALGEIDISFPRSCKSFPKTDVCPMCHNSANSIRIVYGLPSKEMFEKSENGEVKLGGCVIDYCMPHHYCRTDKIDY
jgi:hypothetical protein